MARYDGIRTCRLKNKSAVCDVAMFTQIQSFELLSIRHTQTHNLLNEVENYDHRAKDVKRNILTAHDSLFELTDGPESKKGLTLFEQPFSCLSEFIYHRHPQSCLAVLCVFAIGIHKLLGFYICSAVKLGPIIHPQFRL